MFVVRSVAIVLLVAVVSRAIWRHLFRSTVFSVKQDNGGEVQGGSTIVLVKKDGDSNGED
jgi:hypothetical protein